MIREHNNDMVIDIPLLEVGTEDVKFALIKNAVLKLDVNSKHFIQFIIKGKNGKKIIGRMFGDNVDLFKDNLNKFINKVAAINYTVTTYNGDKTLVINDVQIPDDNRFENIKADLFGAVIPEIEMHISSIITLFNSNTCVFSSVLSSLFNNKLFTSLRFKSDDDICNGENGYVYLIMEQSMNTILYYNKCGLITNDNVGYLYCVLILSECVLNYYDELSFDYTLKVFSMLNKLFGVLNGTENENKLLKEITTSYINSRLSIDTKTEMILSDVLYNVYIANYNNLKQLTLLSNNHNVMQINNLHMTKFIK